MKSSVLCFETRDPSRLCVMPSQKSEVSEWVGCVESAGWWGFWWFQQQGVPSVTAKLVRKLSAGTFRADDVQSFVKSVPGGAEVLKRMAGYALRDVGDDNFRLEAVKPAVVTPWHAERAIMCD